MKHQFGVFLVRWLLNTFGLWVAIKIFGTGFQSGVDAGLFGFLFAGLIFSVINSTLRPLVIILSLPAILLTLGLFTLIVNGFMVYISLMLAPGLHMKFWHSVLTGIVISLLNYIVSSMLELGPEPARKEVKS
jgi:putative membrane protein